MTNNTALSRRRLLQATGGAASAAVLAGCADEAPEDGDDEEDDGEETPAGGDEDANDLNLINSTITSLDPIQSTDTASGQVVQQVYEPLTKYPNGETRIENLLAEDVEISDDLLTYTFTLKETEFHDGTELTADDFVYSLRRLAESPNSERANFLLGDIFLSVDYEEDEEGNVVPDSLAAEAVDDRTLEITLRSPNPNALELLAYDSFSAIPEGIVGDIEGYDGDIEQSELASETMVGTGPFEFDEWQPDSFARVERYDDYHGSVANVDGVHWQILEDDDAGFTYAMEGSADLFGPSGGMPTAQYDPDLIDAETDDRGRQVGTYGPMENDETVEYVGVPQLSTFYVAFNAPSVPRPVRQAIAYVTDHDELITEVFKERGEEAFTFTPPGTWPGGRDAYEAFIDDYPYSANETDRDAAREVLEEAGYTADDPYELTLTTYESDVFQEFGRLTRDKLSGLGIELQLETAPFATLIERGENGDLSFYSLGWTWSWPEADYGMFGFEPENTDTSRMPEETNGYYLDWHLEDSDASQKAQEAWERVEANPGPDEEDVRNDAYIEMEEAIWEDMVMIPLYHGLTERFIYDHVDIEPFGAMGDYLQVFNDVTLNE